MRNNGNASSALRPRRSGGSSEALILDCVNADGRRALSAGELISILSASGISGWEQMISRMFSEIHPRVILGYFPSRGVDTVRLVAAYERCKAATGCRSDVFEKSLVGQFVFTT
ncbi:hypothetical protein G6L37_02945 [Agrobacterium rubi]|nr:hypothetical protein [Agrobacterium rubi]NTF24335.1 hypothetical protein [Agrobacterium rubi]